MKGLKLTQIKSNGLSRDFNRYQLSEHTMIPIQSSRDPLWLPGRIIHHLATWDEARIYFNTMAKQYDGFDYEIF